MRKPKDTTNTDPWLILASAMDAGGSNFILDQEAEGQQELVMSSSLPTDGIESVRPIIESNGGKILSVFPDDPMFTEVVLPDGWDKRPTDHSMWSNLVDDNGAVRASMFYKAAFYDRSAMIRPLCRFSIQGYLGREDGLCQAKLVDQKNEVSYISDAHESGDKWVAEEKARAEVEYWLDEHYPDWRNPNAYWEDEGEQQ